MSRKAFGGESSIILFVAGGNMFSAYDFISSSELSPANLPQLAFSLIRSSIYIYIYIYLVTSYDVKIRIKLAFVYFPPS